MDYSPKSKKILGKASIGDRVVVHTDGKKYEGLLMPKYSENPDTVTLKLDSGYTIGLKPDRITVVEKSGRGKPRSSVKRSHDSSKPTITILHTGGTIASKIDYKTGAAYPAISPEELSDAVPELREIANYNAKVVFQMYSGDMEPDHWKILAEKVYDEARNGVDGIIILHGTDTMAYSAAAIAFMVQKLPIPVLFVGSQRSSDRGSADGPMNITCASKFIVKSDFSGVAICMHGTSSDDYCLINPAVNVKKMHTSRRDTFRPIDVKPYAKVWQDGKIEMLRNDYIAKDMKKEPVLRNGIERKVAIIKIRPGITHKELEFYKDYRGIIIEGTGLGNAPVTVLDKYTSHHAKLLDTMKKLSKKGVKMFMVSQCPYGKVNMNVYAYGRMVQDAGIVPLSMTSEAAYTKLIWALGNFPKQVEKIMLENFCGEIIENIKADTFLI
ncbi:MAG: Glu-tRNA(Gln) amidotransferase subunit GatD [Candidatus Aenigmarchaeota archaeon]|nr:Glu-tRNA(Gln) amidotransferase subunit GatD [Candidatus Aenigmarchaeota archaeon]